MFGTRGVSASIETPGFTVFSQCEHRSTFPPDSRRQRTDLLFLHQASGVIDFVEISASRLLFQRPPSFLLLSTFFACNTNTKTP